MKSASTTLHFLESHGDTITPLVIRLCDGFPGDHWIPHLSRKLHRSDIRPCAGFERIASEIRHGKH